MFGTIWNDGACVVGHGRSGFGIVIRDNEDKLILSKSNVREGSDVL